MEEPSLREMAEYLSEANREELDKAPGRPVTVIVYQNGESINLFRVVDRDSLSPGQDSLRLVTHCYVILPCTYIAPKSDISFRGALQRIIVYWVAEGDRYDCQLII